MLDGGSGKSRTYLQARLDFCARCIRRHIKKQPQFWDCKISLTYFIFSCYGYEHPTLIKERCSCQFTQPAVEKTEKHNIV